MKVWVDKISGWQLATGIWLVHLYRLSITIQVKLIMQQGLSKLPIASSL